jgi:hypothetical protein
MKAIILREKGALNKIEASTCSFLKAPGLTVWLVDTKKCAFVHAGSFLKELRSPKVSDLEIWIIF